jgi:hypothetical protein
MRPPGTIAVASAVRMGAGARAAAFVRKELRRPARTLLRRRSFPSRAAVPELAIALGPLAVASVALAEAIVADPGTCAWARVVQWAGDPRLLGSVLGDGRKTMRASYEPDHG